MTTLLTDPFRALLALQRSLDHTMDSPWLAPTTSARGSYPLVNIFQQGDDFVLVAELPGVRKEDLDLQVHGNALYVSGVKPAPHGEGGVKVHRRERVSGAFNRVINFPVDIDADGVKAECRDGILAIFVPRATHERPRRVTIV